MTAWSLVTCTNEGTERIAALRADGKVVEVPDLKEWASMLDLLDDWAAAEPVLRALDVEAGAALPAARVLAPIRYPRKVICAGVNYRQHIREMGAEVPGDEWTPFFFLKPPTTTVIGPTDDVAVLTDPEARHDWEAELAVVIGAGGADIEPPEAYRHVAGYCVANDITARGFHRRETVPAPAFSYDWFASKSRDASLPLGPGITPHWQVRDPQRLRMRLWLNGELQQDASTEDMICDIPALVAAASRVVTLEPGDVIATGTPSGVGAGRGLRLRPGDEVRTEIESLGVLRNRAVARSRPAERSRS